MRVRLGWTKKDGIDTWKGHVRRQPARAVIEQDKLTITLGKNIIYLAYGENTTLKRLALQKLKALGVKTYDEIRKTTVQTPKQGIR